MIKIENELVTYEIGNDGSNRRLIDRRTGVNRCVPGSPAARIKIRGREIDASSADGDGNLVTVGFGTKEAVTMKVTAEKDYIVIEVASITGEDLQEIAFPNLDLVQGPGNGFSGCILALNLKTNVVDLPGANKHLVARCYAKFGLIGARAALIACPHNQLRDIMKHVVEDAEGIPHSPIGGPWALDSNANRCSYLFNFGDLSEDNVDDWIKLANELGATQIDFHGGKSFRFGDCRPNPETYPKGLASMRAVTDKLHEAGILAGLHTYAFFIDKQCPWVTPIPDPRLAKDATFTLARPMGTEDDEVMVVEPTLNMSTVTGFFVRNSVTLQIDDELITYSDIRKEPPYSFAGCHRGVHGTSISHHRKGAKVHHLKECFGLFVPDGDSTLLAEVAAKTARAFNEGGFDMMYLDALDGEDVIGGREWGWHYGSKFVFEIWKRLKKPALMEMSTFHHHLWYVRSRMGAWDHPSRGHKKFIDIHLQANEANGKMFLPSQLGWWAFKTWSGPQVEPTFPDVIEYLCCKALATDTGLSVMGIDPEKLTEVPALSRLVSIMGTYEKLRISNYFPESIKDKLRVPGKEFSLFKDGKDNWRFRPVTYTRQRVENLDWGSVWEVNNRFASQPVKLRIEALAGAAPYDSPEAVTMTDFTEDWTMPETAEESIRAKFGTSSTELKVGSSSGCYTAVGSSSGCYTAVNDGHKRTGAWAKTEVFYSPPLDLSSKQAMGVWIHGDGQNEVLNLQLRSPQHVSHGIGEHYVVVDFVGWRYYELIEPEGQRYDDYQWPYGSPYEIYRESVDYKQVKSLSLWYNNLPPNQEVTCYLSPIRAMPLVKIGLINPSITIDGKRVLFPTKIETGSYLEFNSMEDCKLYGPSGECLGDVKPGGEIPIIGRGMNKLVFKCGDQDGPNPRAMVTLVAEDKPL